jgi:hypothetical protein
MSTGQHSKTLAKSILDKKRSLVADGKHLDIKKLPSVTFHELCKEYWGLHGKNLRTHGLEAMIEIWKTGFGNVEENFHRVERSYGAFGRAFTLSTSVDPDKIRTNYKAGVLSITLPKAEAAKPKRIQIAGTTA